ncbi:MAG: ABC transporter permease [Alphaproteobacteria bacterium]|jgi:microcin C transport system permease protein
MKLKPYKILGLIPATEIAYRRWLRFLADKRALFSLVMVVLIFGTSLLANLIANDRPLYVSYKGKSYFPMVVEYPESEFNGFAGPTNYYDPFIAEEIEDNGFMVWPVVPYHYRRVVKDAGSEFPSPPDGNHWLGTDDKGRDVVARLIYGIRISFLFGFMYVAITAVVGIAAGAVMGYFGGWVDLVFQRILEIYGSLPTLFIIIAIAGVVQPNFWLLLGLLSVFGWTGYVGTIRAEFLKARNYQYITAARALGVSNALVMWRHVFPNAMVGTITFMPFALAGSVTVLSGLDFLGFGMPPGSPSLGEMTRQGLANITKWWLVYPIFAGLGTITMLMVFIGEGVRNAMDPRKAIRIKLPKKNATATQPVAETEASA